MPDDPIDIVRGTTAEERGTSAEEAGLAPIEMANAADSSPKGGGKPTGATKGPNEESATDGFIARLVFDPTKSPKAKGCARIVHVQVYRILLDGKWTMPSTFRGKTEQWKDRYVVGEGWLLDFLVEETTPDYQQNKPNDKDNSIGSKPAKKNGKPGGDGKARMKDDPSTPGGGMGFFNPKTNPNGYKELVFEYKTFAWCMGGKDCPNWYEGVEWNYKKTWQERASEKSVAVGGKDNGKSVITNYRVDRPPEVFIKAFDRFNELKKYIPCK